MMKKSLRVIRKVGFLTYKHIPYVSLYKTYNIAYQYYDGKRLTSTIAILRKVTSRTINSIWRTFIVNKP